MRLFWTDEEAVGGAVAAAVAGDDGELSGGVQLGEDLLHASTAEAGSLLEGRLVGSPLAVLVAVGSDDEQDGEG